MNRMARDCGRFIDRRTMIWTRELAAPVDMVWEAVSTRSGLEAWWLGGRVEVDLRPGGLFRHAWDALIVDLRAPEFIEIEDVPAGTGGMRIELCRREEHTRFAFMDSWGEHSVAKPADGQPNPLGMQQPGGPGTPWARGAADWHAMVDRLEHHLTGRGVEHGEDDLVCLYARVLTDHFRWEALAADRGRASPREDRPAPP